MATRESGFMGEPFPSKKFQQVIAEYLGHLEPAVDELKHSIQDKLNDPECLWQLELYKAQIEDFRWKIELDQNYNNMVAYSFLPHYTQRVMEPSEDTQDQFNVAGEPHFCAAPSIAPIFCAAPEDTPVHFEVPPIMAPEVNLPPPPDSLVVRMGACPPGFKRVEPEYIPKLSYDDLLQEVITLRLALANANKELAKLRNQQS